MYNRIEQKQEKTNCLTKLTGNSATLKYSKFSTQENCEIKMQWNYII